VRSSDLEARQLDDRVLIQLWSEFGGDRVKTAPEPITERAAWPS